MSKVQAISLGLVFFAVIVAGISLKVTGGWPPSIIRSMEGNIAAVGGKISYFHQALINEAVMYSLEKEGIIAAGPAQGLAMGAGMKGLSGVLPFSKITNYCGILDASSLTGQADLVKYLNYNVYILEKNTEKRWPIASVTKLMTAVIAVEDLNPEARVKISEQAATVGGSSIGNFKTGEMFKVSDLVKAMLVASSNDAAVALAQSMGDKEFIDAMQRKASDLGMFDTTYIEPTGLSFVNQSTISDLAKLATYIYENHPEILAITRQPQVEILELKSGQSRTLSNVDPFAGSPDFIGGKTGFTDEARRNLVALFRTNNEMILTVVLGSDDSFIETAKLKEFVTTCNPNKYGFANWSKST